MRQVSATAASATCFCGWYCALMLLGGCKPPAPETTPDTVVASAYGHSLKASELIDGLPAGLTPSDSAALAARAVSEWLERQAIVHLAETELPAEERDFERTVQRYRESLFIHAYEDRYLRDHLDTSLTTDELQDFLDTQPDLFRLDAPLFRARWMVFAEDQPFPRDVRDLSKQLASKDAEKLSALASRCTDAGIPFDLEASRWWTWSELGEYVPLESKRASRQQNSRWVSKIEWKADTALGRPFDQRALLLVTERLPIGAVSPLERVADRIAELLLHRRRNLTLEAMRQQAVQTAWAEEALSSGDNGASTPAPAATTDRNDTP